MHHGGDDHHKDAVDDQGGRGPAEHDAEAEVSRAVITLEWSIPIPVLAVVPRTALGALIAEVITAEPEGVPDSRGEIARGEPSHQERGESKP